jgi:hypothetical protein
MKITKSQLKQLIKEEFQSYSEQSTPKPKFRSVAKPNNLVAVIYFSYNKADNNTQALWSKVINTIQQEDGVVVNYVVTNSVFEVEFRPEVSGNEGEEDIMFRVKDALKPLSSAFTNYDVYIVE